MINNGSINKRLIAMLMILVLLLSSFFALCACQADTPPDNTPEQPDDSNNKSDSYLDKVITPEYYDYGRGTVNFNEIKYTRPDISSAIVLVNDTAAHIKGSTLSFEQVKEKIVEIDKIISDIRTMKTIAQIGTYKNSELTLWNEENEYISTNYTALIKAIEDLKTIAANSADSAKYEAELFGEGFVEDYKNKDEMSEAELNARNEEQTLINSYNALSTASIQITFRGITDTTEKIINYYKSRYNEASTEYISAYTSIMQLYTEKHSLMSADILMKLFAVRAQLAKTLGYSNYIDYYYATESPGYTKEEISEFLTNITVYILPVYVKLYSYVFYYYFQTMRPEEITYDKLLNDGYDIMSKLDPELHSIYKYMLQHKLFDIEDSKPNRFDGAFTTYIYNYNAPFLFISGGGNISDYSTLFHEFGHFADYYTNGNLDVSIDITEIASQTLELLTLDALGEKLGTQNETFLLYSALEDALTLLIFQGFYASVEMKIYSLSAEDITSDNINNIIIKEAENFKFNIQAINSLSDVFIPHYITSPMYVHSYCTSVIPSLDIYFTELENEGKGLELYKALINRADEESDFKALIEKLGLASPFVGENIKALADKIHFKILGSHYYEAAPPENAA